MHRRDGFAQPVGLAGEVTADLVGVEVALGEQVANAGGGHRPALGRVAFILGRHAQRTAGVDVRSGQLVGTQRRATCGFPARPRTRLSSMSGLTPGLTRRNTFKMASRSKITLVLLCSASDTRG